MENVLVQQLEGALFGEPSMPESIFVVAPSGILSLHYMYLSTGICKALQSNERNEATAVLPIPGEIPEHKQMYHFYSFQKVNAGALHYSQP
jgi:hypothetical protein